MFKTARITSNKKTTIKEWASLDKAIAYAKRWSTTGNHVLTEVYDEDMNLVFSTNSVEAVPVEVVEEDYTEQHKTDVAYVEDKKYSVAVDLELSTNDPVKTLATLFKAAMKYAKGKNYRYMENVLRKWYEEMSHTFHVLNNARSGGDYFDNEYMRNTFGLCLTAYETRCNNAQGIFAILLSVTFEKYADLEIADKKEAQEEKVAETNIMSGADAMTLNERLADYGSFALTDAELLSVVTHVKPENFKGVELPLLLSDPELYVKGIGKKKRQLLNVVKELTSRLQAGAIANKVPVNNSTVAAKLLADYQYDTREHFLAILLTVKNTVIKIEEISVGSLSASIVHPREVFFAAIKYHAASVIVAHNHPSGFTSPSREDCQVTKRLVKAGKILDIPVLDHIIVGNGTHFSFKDRCMLE